MWVAGAAMALLLAVAQGCMRSACPDACECSASTTDCSARKLTTPECARTSTQTLDLRRNNITLQSDSPIVLVDSTTLLLSRNDISNVREQMFASSSLTTLDLSANRITFIADSAFNDCPAVKTLILGSNRLTSLSDSLNFPLSLTSIDLSNNLLTTLPVVRPASVQINLLSLDLSNNFIQDIPNGFFAQMTKLTSLNLASNTIFSLPSTSFQALVATKIDLSFNSITSIAFDAFAGASTFQCSNNRSCLVSACANQCGERSICRGTLIPEATFNCTCQAGFFGAPSCKNDPCATSPCNPNSICSVGNNGGPSCTCASGYQPDPNSVSTCLPVNPCANSTFVQACGNFTRCVQDGPGVAHCECLDSAYSPSQNGKNCVNASTNLCASNNGGCPIGVACVMSGPSSRRCICTNNFWSNNSVDCIGVTSCITGQYRSKAPTTSSDAVCSPCPAGYACSGGLTDPVPCGFVSFFSKGGTSSCSKVQEGYYTFPLGGEVFNRTGAETCPVGYRCSGGLRLACLPPLFQGREGASTCDVCDSCDDTAVASSCTQTRQTVCGSTSTASSSSNSVLPIIAGAAAGGAIILLIVVVLTVRWFRDHEYVYDEVEYDEEPSPAPGDADSDPLSDRAPINPMFTGVAISPWFHGNISQQEAEKRLTEAGLSDGDFLVSQIVTTSASAIGERMPEAYLITVAFEGKPHHFHVRDNGHDKISVNHHDCSEWASTITELIEGLQMSVQADLPTMLLRPVVQEDEFSGASTFVNRGDGRLTAQLKEAVKLAKKERVKESKRSKKPRNGRWVKKKPPTAAKNQAPINFVNPMYARDTMNIGTIGGSDTLNSMSFLYAAPDVKPPTGYLSIIASEEPQENVYLKQSSVKGNTVTSELYSVVPEGSEYLRVAMEPAGKTGTIVERSTLASEEYIAPDGPKDLPVYARPNKSANKQAASTTGHVYEQASPSHLIHSVSTAPNDGYEYPLVPMHNPGTLNDYEYPVVPMYSKPNKSRPQQDEGNEYLVPVPVYDVPSMTGEAISAGQLYVLPETGAGQLYVLPDEPSLAPLPSVVVSPAISNAKVRERPASEIYGFP
eukprot:m.105866 g.105866  ORF g.105866 m.105866 type:complete len:1077 (+) comp51662_c0_seq5:155-3385(+)